MTENSSDGKKLNLYIDLLVTDRDVTLNMAGEPVTCNNRVSVGQDIIHAIIESGLATLLTGERSPILRDDIFTRMILLVEEDRRIVPGTVRIYEETMEKLLISADSWDFGKINGEVNYG